MQNVTATITVTTINMDGVLWGAYLLCAIIGGLASSCINNEGELMTPHKKGDDNRTYLLGALSDVIVGFAAAIGILWAINPQTTFQLLGMGAISGYGGSSILRGLLNRIVAQEFKEEVDSEVKRKNEIISKGIELSGKYVDEADKLKEKLETILRELPDDKIEELEERGVLV